jgi:hypothetical protein
VWVLEARAAVVVIVIVIVIVVVPMRLLSLLLLLLFDALVVARLVRDVLCSLAAVCDAHDRYRQTGGT